MSFTNNISVQNYPHPDDHTKQTNDWIVSKILLKCTIGKQYYVNWFVSNLSRPSVLIKSIKIIREFNISTENQLFLACMWRHEILKSKIKELPKFLFSSCRRGANFISVNNFLAQQHASFGNQRILNVRVMVVRDINLWSCLAKIYNYLGIFWPFEQ